jgi:cell wall-associated NlpC family hydrolase
MKVLWEGKNITEYISSCEWSGSASQCSRTLSFDVANSPYDKGFKNPNIKTGDTIKMYDDAGKLRFVGGVQERARQGEAGTLTYQAQDYMIHLIRSKATYKFKKKTAEAIAKKVCRDVKVKPGKLKKTKVKIKKMFCEGMGLYDIILTAYRKAAKKTGKKYIVQMNGVKLDVVIKGGIIANYKLEPSTSITASHYGESTAEVINKVAIYKKNKRIGTVQSKTSVKKYGIFQDALSVEKGKGKTEAKKMLQGIGKDADVEALGDIRAVSGKGIRIKDPGSGLTGVFWIENDTHRFEGGVHTMSLTLAFKNVMDTASSSGGGSSSSSSSSDGDDDTGEAGDTGDKVVELAKSYAGKVTYIYGAASPENGKSDCSGFTEHCYKKAAGKAIGRTTGEQVGKGEEVAKSKAAPGDLVFFKDTYNSGYKYGVSHAGICLGGGMFIHCSSSGGVRTSSLSEAYYAQHFLMVRRVI